MAFTHFRLFWEDYSKLLKMLFFCKSYLKWLLYHTLGTLSGGGPIHASVPIHAHMPFS